MESYNKTRRNVIIISVCIICILILAVLLGIHLSSDKKEQKDAVSERKVAQIGNMEISEAEFKFFANILMIEEEEMVKDLYEATDISTSDELKKYTSNFAKEYMIRVSEAKKNKTTLTDSEKETVHKQIKEDYDSVRKSDKQTSEMSEKEFYDYYYGISKEKYTEFWENWYLIDKYTNICEKNADVSEKNQEAAFEEYYDYLYTYHISVIPFVIDAENTLEKQKQNAETAKNNLENGGDFETLLRQYSEDKDLLSLGGKTKFYPANKGSYEEVYDWLRVNPIGSIDIIETKYAIYLVRLDDVSDFKDLVDTENMLKWTRTFVVNKELNDILDSEEYKYVLDSEVYESIDLSNIIDNAFSYWTTVWENDNK